MRLQANPLHLVSAKTFVMESTNKSFSIEDTVKEQDYTNKQGQLNCQDN